MYAVLVGVPFEEQAVFGPFECRNDALAFAATCHGCTTWVFTLLDPKEFEA